MDWGETDCVKGGHTDGAGKLLLPDNGKTTGGLLVTAGEVDRFWNAGVLIFVGLGEVSRGLATVQCIGVSLGFDLIPTGGGWATDVFTLGRVADRRCRKAIIF